MIAWTRHLQIELTSSVLKKKLIFGTNYLSDKDDLYLDVQGHKYLSSLKDEATIKIKNLTMAEVIQIIDGKYYDVDIKCGYKSSNVMTVYSGSVMYVSNEIDDRKSNTIIILCASKFLAKYGQTRLNLSMTSGINIYSAINFVCRRSQIPNTNVSTQFKKQFLQNVENTNNESSASWIDKLCSNNSSFMINTDASNTSIVSIFDAAKSNNRIITLRNDNIILQEYPQLTTNGFTLNVMPTFNFMPGDVIKIDNSILQIPVYNKSEISKSYGNYLDKDGYYLVFEVKYNLQNRGSNFNMQLLCKSKSLISNTVK